MRIRGGHYLSFVASLQLSCDLCHLTLQVAHPPLARTELDSWRDVNGETSSCTDVVQRG